MDLYYQNWLYGYSAKTTKKQGIMASFFRTDYLQVVLNDDEQKHLV